QAEARARALVGALVGRRGHHGHEVGHRHLEGLAVSAAVLVGDLHRDRVPGGGGRAVVGVGVRGRGDRALGRQAEGGVQRSVTPVHIHHPGVVVHPDVAEAALAEARARALVRALVGGRGDRGSDVVDRHGCRVLAEAAVLVDDPGAHREAAVVGEGAARRGARAAAGVSRGGQRDVGAAIGVVEAGGGVGRGRMARGGQGERDRAALVDRGGGGERRRGGDVGDGYRGRVFGERAVFVLELALHRAAAVVGGRAARAARAAEDAVARAVAAIERVLESGRGVGRGGCAGGGQGERDGAARVDRGRGVERRRGGDVGDGYRGRLL